MTSFTGVSSRGVRSTTGGRRGVKEKAKATTKGQGVASPYVSTSVRRPSRRPRSCESHVGGGHESFSTLVAVTTISSPTATTDVTEARGLV